MKPERVQRQRSEIREALREQLVLLVSYCESYDAGERAFAKPMACALRICLHHSRQSHSLLEQLGLRSGRFYSVARKLEPGAIPIGCQLLAMRYSQDKGGEFLPLLRELGFKDRLPFSEWWTDAVLLSPTGVSMSRMDIVTAVANMDGGAHVDPKLESKYAAFRSGRMLGFKAAANPMGQIMFSFPLMLTEEAAAAETDAALVTGPQYASIRSIAHEFLLTMQKYAGSEFGKAYEPVYEVGL